MKEKYKLIYCDCPWEYHDMKSNDPALGGIRYPVMSDEDLQNLPINDITDKDSILLMWATMPKLQECLDVIKAWGFCCVPETRILKKDLTWVKASELKEGDELFAFDEHPTKNKRRYYKFSKVESTGIVKLPCYEITLSNGDKLTCSDEHEWLVRYRQPCGQTGTIMWKKTKDLLDNYDGRRKSKVEIIKLANVKSFIDDWDSGFISGAFDSEGSLNKVKPRVCFSQKGNPLLDKTEEILNKHGVEYGKCEIRENLYHLDIRGGVKGTLDFLQMYRPPRLLNKWKNYNFDNNSLYCQDGVEVVDVKFVGEKEVVALQTSSRTYIAEGYASHNTYKSCFFNWVKLNPNATIKEIPIKGRKQPDIYIEGGIRSGMGSYTCGNAELVLVAKKGKGLPRFDKSVKQIQIHPMRRHSEKPSLHSEIERVYGNDIKRAELFARRKVEGWDCFGNDIDGKDIKDVLKDLVENG